MVLSWWLCWYVVNPAVAGLVAVAVGAVEAIRIGELRNGDGCSTDLRRFH